MSNAMAFLVLVTAILGAAAGSEIYSLNEDAETIRTLKVASSGQLLVRSSRTVYLLNETGHREGSRQVIAISFLQSDDLSSDTALLCTNASCELVRLSDLNTEIWSKNVAIGNPLSERDILSIITKKSNTEISLNTARVSPGTDSFILDIIRYDLEFTSDNYSVQPMRYVDYHFDNDQLCSECTGEFHETFSVGGDSFYVGVQQGDGGKTYFYHTNNQDVGLIRPGRGNRFICSEEGSLKCGELTAADHAHFSRASSGDGHTLFLSYGGVICKYDYSNWQTIFTSLAMTGCGGSEATLSPLLNVSSLGEGGGAVTALGSVVTNQHRFLLVAFEDGSLHQYLVSGSTAPILLDTNQLPSSEDVVEIVSSRDDQSYYVVTRKKIYQFSIQRCSRHTSCEACVTTPNPLCGWCSAEGRCGTIMDCPTSGQPNHYVAHGNNTTCPVITMVTPSTIDVQNISNITLATRHVPQDGGINYECRYVFDRNGDEFRRPATGLGGGDYLCSSPPQDRLKEIVTSYTGEASPRLQLVRYLTTEPRVVVETNHVTYFDCQSYTSCVPCVSQSTCQWCAESATCGAKGGSCSSPYTEPTKRFCPQITPSGTAKYTLFAHVNETKALSVPVSFRDDTLQVSTNYQCVFMRDGSEQVVAGTLSTVGTESGGMVSGFINCNERNFGSRPTELEVQVRFSLQDNREYILDNPNMIRVHVYNCGSSNISDCSECVTLPGELDCGYCREDRECSFTPQSSCPSSLLRTSSISCPVNVTDFTPRGGPTGGGTTITITGFNLPLRTTDVDSITIGSAQCGILQSNFQPAEKLTCTTGQAPVMSSPITISFTDGNNTLRTIQTAISYSFVDVTLTSVEPSSGIASGGTVLTLTGPSLVYGSQHEVELELETGTKLPCPVNEEYRQPGSLQCTTPNHGQAAGDIDVLVTIDNQNTKLENAFSYEDDPEVTSVSPNRSFALGGIPFRVIGRGFDIVQTPQLIFRFTPATAKRQASQVSPTEVTSQCRVTTSTLIECPSPGTSAMPPTAPVAVVITMDGLTVSDVGTNVTIFPNPTFETIGDVKQTINNYEDITIKADIMMPDFAGQYLMVTIGNSPRCKISSLTTTEVVCRPGNITDNMAGTQHNVTVKLGNHETLVGRITFEREFDYILYIVLPVLGFVLLCAVLILLVACCICQRRVKKKVRRVDELQEELHQIESSVVKTVKAGFAELNAEVEETYGEMMHQHLPYRDVPSYVYHSFFHEDSPAIVTESLGGFGRSRDVQQGLADFRRLLSDKKFLLTVIRTLEDKNSFDISNRSRFATLLMVALCGKLDYATEVLRELLCDQIRQLAIKGETHLFMRKTQSVSDKMLSCWLALCLRDHVENTSAYPLYMLYRATKSQLDKGPVDVVSGESKYSLSERSILRSIVTEVEEITATVETDDGGRFPVRMLDCDTITQAKEKIIDAVFKSVRASQRFGLEEVDLEWRLPDSTTRLLRDEDQTSVVDGPWRRINTLKHYEIPSNGAVFRLIPRKEEPSNGHAFDHIGTLVASHTLTSRHRMSSITSDGLHLWHLSKQADFSNGNSPFTGRKLMTELFFPQMMTTKNILQKYVDDFVESAFTVYGKPPYNVSPGSVSAVYANIGSNEVPHAIKYLFDLLDSEAADNSIHDPNIVHVWKCNSLNLRFWVNLIKNPEFIFDIQKSHSVDSCLSVIAQALMDSCSIRDDVLTGDAPAGKLLFHKDVRRYRQSIKKYFEDIRRRPHLVPQQMKNYLMNLSLAYDSELIRSRSNKGVDLNRVLYGLFEITLPHSDEVIEALDCAGLFNQSQTYRSIKASLS